jgi:adenylate kinase
MPENMYLNQVPHNRYVRQYFYDTCTAAVKQAVFDCAASNDNSDNPHNRKRRSNRMLVTSEFPEMNPAMDSYRIGTLLEMARAVTIGLAEENLRVRLCVQGSMGAGIFTGLPKQLSGVSKLMQLMDWESEEGETNEGMVGTFVNFGNIGAEFVVNEQRDVDGTTITQHQDDVFILLCPQNMVGTDSSIIPWLQEMVEAAGDRPVILINPDLTDKVSAAGQQSVRGRQQRIDFAESFDTVYHWQNIYVTGTSYFPILGTITKLRPDEQWIAYQRRDFASSGDSGATGASDETAGEIYVPVLAGETKPTGQDILEAFQR